jgi:hypothetical protein
MREVRKGSQTITDFRGLSESEKLDALVASCHEERKDAILVRHVAITTNQMSAVKGWQGLYQVP